MNRAMTLVVGFLLIGVTLVSGSGIIYLTNSAGSPVVLSVTPAITNTSIGGSFAVAINVSSVRDLGKWEITISWNASIIDLDQSGSGAVAEGPFLRSANAPTKLQFDPYMSGSGVLSGVSCFILQAKGASGTGSVLYLRFKAIGVGTTSITIGEAKLYDYMGRIMIPPPSIDSGTVNVSPASVSHDVAVVAFDCPTSVVAGQFALLNVTVENLGTSAENGIQVRLDVNGSLCKSNPTSVPAHSQIKTHFNWTASLVGTHNLTVSVDLMSEDANLTNNVAWKLVTVVVASYDLAILLDTPSSGRITLDGNVWLNASVLNLGSMNESNVEASIYVDGEPKHHEVIPSLVPEESHQIGCLWIPQTAKTFNITAFVTCALFDSNTSNNIDSRNVTVIPSAGRASILIVSDDGGYGSQYGTSLNDFKAALAGISFDVWAVSVNGTIKDACVLESYGLVIWTCGDYRGWVIDPLEQRAIIEYSKKGGNILLEGASLVSNLRIIGGTELQDVLQVDYSQYLVGTTGIEPVYSHPIARGLASEENWTGTHTCYPDGVVATGKAFTVMRYAATNFSAVTVVDGSETGKGSVVYYSFPVFCLPENFRDTLVRNTVNWFSRFGVSVVLGRIIKSPAYSVQFLYGDLRNGNGSEFDMTAGSMLYSLSENEQVQEFAGTANTSELNGSLVCLFGSPLTNGMVNYFNASGKLPVLLCQNSSDSSYYLLGKNTFDKPIGYFEASASGNRSFFSVMVFVENGVTYLAIYGLDWRGTWAAGLELSRAICRNLRDYCGTYYMFKWEDSNGDLLPQLWEISMEASG